MTSPALPSGWSSAEPQEADAPGLAVLLRLHEEHARGWSGASQGDVLVELSRSGDGSGMRQNLALRDAGGRIRGWASAHDRAAGRMLLTLLVDWELTDDVADQAAAALLGWAEEVARRVGRRRGLETQQVDTGAFADDARQQRWLTSGGFEQVRTWWQMTRPVAAHEAGLEAGTGPGVRIRLVAGQVTPGGDGMPDEDDLRTVHDVLETAFADHFNRHAETFAEFVSRLREDPGHRWDHWWVAELVDGPTPERAGALVGSVVEGDAGKPDGSYVSYIGVLPNARGRGVARSLLRTIIADAASNRRDRVGLEVDADSPTGADRLYESMGWTTTYVTQSWHKDVPTSRDVTAS